MTKNTTFAAILSLSLLPLAAAAQSEPPELAAVPEPPPLPEQVQSGETLEPDITIIRREKEVVTEYRVNGKLQAIKVEPKNAPAYYLVDADGDGSLETRSRGLGPEFLIPQWVIFSW
jgi:hypothetical protein